MSLGTLFPSRSGLLLEEGFGWLWLRGVWDPGEAGRWIAQRSSLLLERFREDLADVEIGDIDGPALPPRGYRVREDLGGDEGLDTLRADLLERGIRLLLDFVPDCVAVDHPWVTEQPGWIRHPAGGPCPEESPPNGGTGLPSLPAAVLDHRHPGLQAALVRELERVASRADGLFLAGAMSLAPQGFWEGALARLRSGHPRLLLLHELPRALPDSIGGVQLDWTFRDLAPSAHYSGIAAAMEHGDGGPKARCLEDHGGPRAAERLPRPVHEAAAVLAYLSADLAIFSDGEIEGRRRAWNPFLARRAAEEPDGEIRAFYQRLLDILGRPAARGPCRVLPLSPAWEGNESRRQVTVFTRGEPGDLLLVAVNFGPFEAQCYASVEGLLGESGGWLLQDLFSTQIYSRDRGDLAQRGLYLGLAPWDYNVFEVTGRPAG